MSETHAQNTRPKPLKMEITITIVAAATGAIWIMSCAMGEAMLMIMMPAETLRKSMDHRSQNCQVRIASVTPKSTFEAAFCTADFGTHPAGTYPAGGLA